MSREDRARTDEQVLDRLKTTNRPIVLIADLDTVSVDDLSLDYKIEAILVVIHYGLPHMRKEELIDSYKEVLISENRFETFEENFQEENLNVLKKFKNTTFILVSKSKSTSDTRDKIQDILGGSGNDFLTLPKLYPHLLKAREI